jgi:WD40 repeat protein
MTDPRFTPPPHTLVGAGSGEFPAVREFQPLSSGFRVLTRSFIFSALPLAAMVIAALLTACATPDSTPDALTSEPTYDVTAEVAPTTALTLEATLESTSEPTAEPTSLPLIPDEVGTYSDFIGAPLPPGAIDRIGLGRVETSALSPGGTLYAVGSASQVVVLEPATLNVLWKAAMPQQVLGVTWSPDGAQLAAWLVSDLRLVLFDGASGAILRISSFPEPVRAAAWSPDGALLAVLYGFARTSDVREAYSEVVFFDQNGSVVQSFPLPRPIYSNLSMQGATLVWSQDGRLVAAGSQPGAFVWDVASGDLLLDSEQGVQLLDFNPQGTMLAGAMGTVTGAIENSQIFLWGLADNSVRVLSHTENLHPSALAWSPAGTILASAASNENPSLVAGEVYLWNAASGELLHSVENHISMYFGLQWLDSSRFSAAGVTYPYFETEMGMRSAIDVWDSASSSLLTVLTGSGYLRTFEWLPDNTQVISAGWERVTLWDAAAGEVLRTIPTEVHLGDYVWSDDSTHLVASPSPEPLTPDIYSDPIFEFSPDGTRIASFDDDDQFTVKDALTGAVVFAVTGHSERIFDVKWSPDGTMLASAGGYEYAGWPFLYGCEENAILIWDAATGTLLHRFLGHTGGAGNLLWSPESTRLASGAADDTILIWNIP